MRKYEKPIIKVNCELAEGVYAASGNNPGCDSKYMNGIFQVYKGGWDTTVREYYGCIGCPAYRNQPEKEIVGCALLVDQAYKDGATSYGTDSGNRMPEWERKGLSADLEINNANGLPY